MEAVSTVNPKIFVSRQILGNLGLHQTLQQCLHGKIFQFALRLNKLLVKYLQVIELF